MPWLFTWLNTVPTVSGNSVMFPCCLTLHVHNLTCHRNSLMVYVWPVLQQGFLQHPEPINFSSTSKSGHSVWLWELMNMCGLSLVFCFNNEIPEVGYFKENKQTKKSLFWFMVPEVQDLGASPGEGFLVNRVPRQHTAWERACAHLCLHSPPLCL